MKKIYLATPYSHPEASVRESRFLAVNKAAADMMRRGLLVFSPISHTHPIGEASDLPKDWEFWKQFDLTFIEWADELHVLMQDGWYESTGVTAEIKIANKMRKPIFYIQTNPKQETHCRR